MSKESKPIIKVWFNKPREAWYQLSEEEQKDWIQREQQITKKLSDKYGTKIIKTCKCRWSNEEWQQFGMEEYPSLEALQVYNDELSKLGMYRYFNAKVILGTPIEEYVDIVK